MVSNKEKETVRKGGGDERGEQERNMCYIWDQWCLTAAAEPQANEVLAS